MATKQPVEMEREKKLDQAMRRREKLSKIRLWAYIVWIIGLMLILARYMKLFPD
ncbi:MAG TPA: hypothetical protein PLO63_06835 [Syntrophales bacterium]|nr:hypothetical protein [Syntrophales bacterium]